MMFNKATFYHEELAGPSGTSGVLERVYGLCDNIITIIILTALIYNINK